MLRKNPNNCTFKGQTRLYFTFTACNDEWTCNEQSGKRILWGNQENDYTIQAPFGLIFRKQLQVKDIHWRHWEKGNQSITIDVKNT